MTTVRLPQWGMGMQEGTIARWLKREGETVVAGEALVEIVTAKANNVLEAPVSGIVARLVVPEGTTVPVNAVIAIVTAPGEPRPSEP